MEVQDLQTRKNELKEIVQHWAEEKKILQPDEMIELELRIVKTERIKVSIEGYRGVGDPRLISVFDVEFCVRTTNCLNNANITTLGQLACKTKKELLGYRNFGQKSLRECQAKLRELGIEASWI